VPWANVSRLVVSRRVGSRFHEQSASETQSYRALSPAPASLWTNRGSVSIAGRLYFWQQQQPTRRERQRRACFWRDGERGRFWQSSAHHRRRFAVANQSDFTFGGTGNRLELSDGAGLICSNAIISALLDGDDNTVLLTGTGTAWTNSGDLTMGFAGPAAC